MKRIPITEIVNDAFVSRNDEIFCQGFSLNFPRSERLIYKSNDNSLVLLNLSRQKRDTKGS